MTLPSPPTRHRKAPRSVAFAALAAALLAAVPAPLAADDSDQIGRLQIVHPWARPAVAGESTRLHLKIVNDGFDDLHVVKLTSPVAARVRLVLIEARGRTVPLGSITVLARETVDLGSPHFRVMLDGLNRDLRAGERIPLTLHFAPFGRITTSVMVGENTEGGPS
jgi:copper(I)-binding protein